MSESERFRPPEVGAEKAPPPPEAQEGRGTSGVEQAEAPEAGEKREDGETPEQARARELQEKNERQSLAIEAIRKDYEALKKTGTFENIDDLASNFSHVTGTLLNHARGYREIFQEDAADGAGDPDDLARAESSTAGLDKYLTYFEQNRDKFFATSRTEQSDEEIKKISKIFDNPANPKYMEDIDALIGGHGSETSGE